MKTKDVEYINLLFIMLDSCRYDTFEIANTPNFDKVGKLHKAYSPGCWTTSTIPSYLYGAPPLDYILKSDIQRRFVYIKEGYGIIKEINYWNGFYSPNPIAYELKDLFKEFEVTKILDYPLDEPSCELIFNDIIKDKEERENRPFMIHTLFMETHSPMWDGTKYISDLDRQFEGQIKAIEYIDDKFGKFIDNIKGIAPTKFVITSDHGDMMGETNEYGKKMYGHDPRNDNLTFHPKLFEIPYIEGTYYE